MEWLAGAVPPKHAAHRLHSLKPYDRNPLPSTIQWGAIAGIPAQPGELKGWVMVGVPGTSKTTYAACAILDWLTWRIVDNIDEPYFHNLAHLNYWRIKAPKWVTDMGAWSTRDFGDKMLVEPEVTPTKVEQVSTDLHPHEDEVARIASHPEVARR